MLNCILKANRTQTDRSTYFRALKVTIEFHKTREILHVKQLLSRKKLVNIESHSHFNTFESDTWQVVNAKKLGEENKLIEAGFEYLR